MDILEKVKLELIQEDNRQMNVNTIMCCQTRTGMSHIERNMDKILDDSRSKREDRIIKKTVEVFKKELLKENDSVFEEYSDMVLYNGNDDIELDVLKSKLKKKIEGA